MIVFKKKIWVIKRNDFTTGGGPASKKVQLEQLGKLLDATQRLPDWEKAKL